MEVVLTSEYEVIVWELLEGAVEDGQQTLQHLRRAHRHALVRRRVLGQTWNTQHLGHSTRYCILLIMLGFFKAKQFTW